MSDEWPFNIVGFEKEDNMSFNVYPNPNQGEFVIRGNFDNYTILDLTVYNVLGETVKELQLNTSDKETRIDLKVESGIYFLSVQGNGNEAWRKKIVIE